MNSADWLKQNVVKHKSCLRRSWKSELASDWPEIDASSLDNKLALAVNGEPSGAQDDATNEIRESVKKAFKHDRTTTVALVQLAKHAMVLKRYNARTASHAFSRAFRRSRASRCWQMSYAFAEAGLNVAAPVLMLERRFGPLRLSAYFVNEYLAGDELLTLLPEMSREQQSRVLEQIETAFELMREAKISHGDLKASNLIWHNDKLYFIDLDAAQRHKSKLSWSKSHQKDRARFQKNWREHPDLFDLFSGL